METTLGKPVQDAMQSIDRKWRNLYIAGAVSAMVMLAFMVFQIVVFVIWPPPSDVHGLFSLFIDNWLLGLLSMDLLYILDGVLLIIIYLALYMTLKDHCPVAMLVGTVLGIVGVGSYFSSNTAFEMLSLAHQYGQAVDPVAKNAVFAAAVGMLEIYSGTAFDIYYVLNTVVLFVYFGVMRKTTIYGKAIPILSLVAGFLMVIPSSAGMLGLVFSLASLIPWAIWLLLVSKRLLSFK